MELIAFTFNPFQENTYVLADGDGQCAIIDPGMSNEEEQHLFTETLQRKGWRPVVIWNTHCHIDHILGNAYCAGRYGIPIHAHRLEQVNIDRSPSASLMWHVPYSPTPDPVMDMEDGGVLELGGLKAETRWVPGHAPGHMAFVFHDHRMVIAGDVLFRESVGRTDLPGCDPAALVRSIREKLYSLPDDFTVYPGHGPATTIGHEKKFNPFVPA